MSETIEVLITIPFDEELANRIRGVSPRLRITEIKASRPEEIPAETWSKVEILYTNRVLPGADQAPRLRWIQFHWAGLDHVADHPLLKNPDLAITTLSGAAASQMAEYAVMMLLSLGHRLPDLIANQKRGEWPRDRWERFSPIELRDSTVGIVGYGSIGRQIARLLQNFGMTVLATKRDTMHPEDSGYTPEGLGDPAGDLVHRLYPPQALRSMLKECDFLVVTVPLTPDTHLLVKAEELAVMKPTAFIVDISRGNVVDHVALISALRDKKIAGAALDVYPEEPLPPESPLWKLPNVIITPHISGNTPHYNERAVALFTENLLRYLGGLPLYNRYDLQRGY
ncbi:MAG: D-2-hydroxyacid dehydrogenase [Chloroflexota bacterium]|nr:MAG: D-2-hydroxyacid dehydrogenase [Chloroflexota bacterium]